ncbi:MAG: InlB B-repeat-containing protein, partial [Clostridia bacterium]|nr:InlB B-repeat-containing protein [Clostridia bacterium]
RGGGALNSEKIAEKADKNGTFSDLKTAEKTLKKETKSTLRDGDFIAEIATMSERLCQPKSAASPLSIRNDTKRYDNKIVCHCEAEQGSAVAISPLCHFERSREISANKENKKSSLKIYALILSIIFLFTALVGGSVFLIVKHINKINASTTTTTTLANIYTTNGTLDKDAVNALLDAVGYLDNPSDTGTYTAHNIASRGTSGSDSTIIFPMGYYVDANGNMDTSKPILWQATYLWNGYLTVWMNTNYVIDYFNYGISTNSGFGNGTSYSSYSNYSKSTLRDVTNNIYAKLNGKLESFSSIIQSPKNADATWQTTQADDVHTYSSSDYDHHNNLDDYNGEYTGWTHSSNWNTSNPPYNDNFWIPSSVEVFNKTPKTTSTTAQVNNGLWGLTAADRGFNTTTIEGSGTVSFCWLRSGHSDNLYYAMLVDSSGSADYSYVSVSRGVRPAAHISLNALEGFLSKTISVASNNSSFGSVSGGGEYENGATATLIATPNAGYKFKGWSTDGENSIISTANPYTITVTDDATYTAVFEIKTYNITFNANNSNLGSIYNHYTTFEHGNTYTFVATATAGCAFLYWIDSADTNTRIYANPLSIVITSDKTYTAYFTDSLLNGVACVAEAGGEVRMNGYTDSDTTIHFSAVAYAGYTFDGWYIYGETTPLSTEWSVDLEKSTINNKLIVAKFSEISANVNTEINNTDKLT